MSEFLCELTIRSKHIFKICWSHLDASDCHLFLRQLAKINKWFQVQTSRLQGRIPNKEMMYKKLIQKYEIHVVTYIFKLYFWKQVCQIARYHQLYGVDPDIVKKNAIALGNVDPDNMEADDVDSFMSIRENFIKGYNVYNYGSMENIIS